MNIYETLLDEAHSEGLIVKEKPLKYNDGRIKGNKIAIREDLSTTNEKACVLAEELGHFHTAVGDIVDQSDIKNIKQERKGRLQSYNRLIGLAKLISAYEYGCQNRYEIAEYLDVTEPFLQECIDHYRDKYGFGTMVGDYYVMFIPHFAVGKIF